MMPTERNVQGFPPPILYTLDDGAGDEANRHEDAMTVAAVLVCMSLPTTPSTEVDTCLGWEVGYYPADGTLTDYPGRGDEWYLSKALCTSHESDEKSTNLQSHLVWGGETKMLSLKILATSVQYYRLCGLWSKCKLHCSGGNL